MACPINPDPNHADRILILKGFRIGDAICQTPAFALLRRYKPKATIDLIVSGAAAEVYQHNPNIDHVIVEPNAKQLARMNAGYDYALAFDPENILTDYIKHLTLPLYFYKNKGPNHLAKIIPDFLNPLYGNTHQDYMAEYALYPQQEHMDRGEAILKAAGAQLDGSEILIGMHMGCYKVAERAAKLLRRQVLSTRSWPFQNFKALANRLYEWDDRIRIVLTGTQGERKLADKIFKQDQKAFNVAGKTSVLELAAMMKHYFHMLITGDTGPMHVATAVKIPLVAMFGSTKPEITGPYPVLSHHTLLCADKMEDISVGKVFNSVKTQLSASLV